MKPTIYYTECPSPLGQLTLAITEKGLCGVYFFDQRNFKGPQDWIHRPELPLFAAVQQQLNEYFQGTRHQFELPLDLTLSGTLFQRTVWNALTEIGYGKTVSYGEHANRIHKPLAVRAVGGAIGKNPISIIVPCHRVIGRDGALTGYDGGLERKKFLLQLEGVI